MPQPNTSAADVVVVGAGMSGLVAATQAQALGARVILLEKGEKPGGSLAMSGGTIWCACTHEDLLRLVPHGDPELGAVLIHDFLPGIEWLTGLGAKLTQMPSEPYRYIYLTEPTSRDFAEFMAGYFQDKGGMLLANTAGHKLETTSGGAISGITVRDPNGLTTISARSVILASGGFQANPEMRSRYFGQWSDRLILRSNPNSTGDSFQMATAIGAVPSKAMSTFYGHLIPAAPAIVPTDDFIGYTMYHSEQSILVNLRGERFCDESKGDETNCQMVARQPDALAVLIYDDKVYRSYAIRQTTSGTTNDTFLKSQALGARVAKTPTVEALVAEVENWGVYGPAVQATIEEYNQAVAAERTAHLRVPHATKVNPIINPPFYALLVTPGITFTLGGLRINTDAQVLDRSSRPIPGLYAAGADAGGIHNEQYAGGLCLGLVFGRRAAQHATTYIKE
ncbi:MAG: FAD-dependent oxidoreductase [Chloroflexi bacterium]|nr:FAD-dependent oxidoreductase [Chloroflexota bacterium]